MTDWRRVIRSFIEVERKDAHGSTLGQIETAVNEAGIVLLKPGGPRVGGRGVHWRDDADGKGD